MFSEEDRVFLQAAVEKAREGIAAGQTPFGACLADGREVVALAHNTVWRDLDSTAHAEVAAIREACRWLRTIDLGRLTLYSTCEPCPMCFGAAHWAGIRRVVFGAGIEDAARAGFSELRVSNQHLRELGGSLVAVEGGLLLEECRELFRIWLAIPGRRAY